MKYYPKNGFIFTAILFVVLSFLFAILSICGNKGGSNIFEDIFFSTLVVGIMLIAPFITFLKKIEIIDSANFIIGNLFSSKAYSIKDIRSILIGKRLGTKYSMYIFLNDNRKIWVSTTFWSNSFFDTLKKYFSKMAPSKIENQLTK